MNGRGKSDKPVVPKKPANNDEPTPFGSSAEQVEGRGLAKGNPSRPNALQTPSRDGLQSALDRIRQAAEQDRKKRFTALWHHVYRPDRLAEAYFALKREAAPGVDGQTWEAYGEELESNLQDLSARLQRGAYRAKPVRRVYIPKADGRQRPIGVPVLFAGRPGKVGLRCAVRRCASGCRRSCRPSKKACGGGGICPFPKWGDGCRQWWADTSAITPCRGTPRPCRRSATGWSGCGIARFGGGARRAGYPWTRMRRLADQWLPRPRILHPYPSQRLTVRTQGRSPVR